MLNITQIIAKLHELEASNETKGQSGATYLEKNLSIHKTNDMTYNLSCYSYCNPKFYNNDTEIRNIQKICNGLVLDDNYNVVALPLLTNNISTHDHTFSNIVCEMTDCTTVHLYYHGRWIMGSRRHLDITHSPFRNKKTFGISFSNVLEKTYNLSFDTFVKSLNTNCSYVFSYNDPKCHILANSKEPHGIIYLNQVYDKINKKVSITDTLQFTVNGVNKCIKNFTPLNVTNPKYLYKQNVNSLHRFVNEDNQAWCGYCTLDMNTNEYTFYESLLFKVIRCSFYNKNLRNKLNNKEYANTVTDAELICLYNKIYFVNKTYVSKYNTYTHFNAFVACCRTLNHECHAINQRDYPIFDSIGKRIERSEHFKVFKNNETNFNLRERDFNELLQDYVDRQTNETRSIMYMVQNLRLDAPKLHMQSSGEYADYCSENNQADASASPEKTKK